MWVREYLTAEPSFFEKDPQHKTNKLIRKRMGKFEEFESQSC